MNMECSTINGKKVVTFRLMKEGFDVQLEESCDRPMKGETEQQFRTRCFGVNPLTTTKRIDESW